MYESVPVPSRVGAKTNAELFVLFPTYIPLPCHAADGCEDVHPPSMELNRSADAMIADDLMNRVFS